MVASVAQLAAILEGAGLRVNTGLAGAGESGTFAPVGLIFHHDAAGLSYVDGWGGADVTTVAQNMAVKGANGAQFWVGRSGVWYILSAGLKWHAGDGDGWGAIGAGDGNAESYGIETDYGPVRSGWSGPVVTSAGYTWPVWDATHLESIYRGSAALAAGLGLSAFCGHMEYAPARKIDPANVSLDAWRAAIADPATIGSGDDVALSDADKAFINDAIADALNKFLHQDKSVNTTDVAATPNAQNYTVTGSLERLIRLVSLDVTDQPVALHEE
jgi:hypothetical protein